MRRDRSRLRQNLTALYVVLARTTKKTSHVVACATFVKKLPEHFDARDGRLRRVADAHDFDFVLRMNRARFNTTRHNSATTRDREDIFHRHQEVFVDLSFRLRNMCVQRVHQIIDALVVSIVRRVFASGERRTLDDRNIITREVVAREQFSNFHLDKLDQLFVVDLVDLVHEHHDMRDVHLASQKNVLARLRHRAVSSRHDQDGAVHLRSTRDHVLHVVSMAGAIDMGVMASIRLVLNVSSRDRNAAFTLFRSLVDVRKVHLLREALMRLARGDGCGQRRLTVIDVTNRAHVHVRLCTLEFCFAHSFLFLDR